MQATNSLSGATWLRSELRAGRLPAAVQSFEYDLDGNLKADGVWTYQYDAENRLTAMETTSAGVQGGMTAQRLEFKYDYMGRRVEKIVRAGYNGIAFTTVTFQCRYLYAGWDMVAEFDAPGGSIGALVRSYTWGLDLAGSRTATGGIGALVQIHDHAQNLTLFPTYDGNGNVTSLVNASSGAVEAVYEYDPSGQFLRKEGAYAASNPFRFSTKFSDEETGLVYYGHRFFSPALGRFINRDPIGEAGGLNLYGFASNDPISGGDYLGLNGLNNIPIVGPILSWLFGGGDQGSTRGQPEAGGGGTFWFPPADSSYDYDDSAPPSPDYPERRSGLSLGQGSLAGMADTYTAQRGQSPTDHRAVAPNSVVVAGSVVTAGGRVLSGVGEAQALANAGLRGVATTLGTTAGVGVAVLGAGVLIIDVGSDAMIADGRYRDNVPLGGGYIARSNSTTSARLPSEAETSGLRIWRRLSEGVQVEKWGSSGRY